MTSEEAIERAMTFARALIKRSGRRKSIGRTLVAYLRALQVAYPDTPAIDPIAVLEQALAEARATGQRTHVAVTEDQHTLALTLSP